MGAAPPDAAAATPVRTLWQQCHDFAHGVWPMRWIILCCWEYVFTTAAGLFLSLISEPAYGGDTGLVLNWLFYINYSLTYWTFLVQYIFMRPRPPALWMLGIAMYTWGYTLFAVYYSISVFHVNAAGLQLRLNVVGSQLFLWGSMALLPPACRMGGWVFSPLKQSSALFWGSFLFLVGSLLFVHDSLSMLLLFSEHRQWVIALGMASFLVGRGFFLRGCQTPECDFLFRRDPRRITACCSDTGEVELKANLDWDTDLKEVVTVVAEYMLQASPHSAKLTAGNAGNNQDLRPLTESLSNVFVWVDSRPQDLEASHVIEGQAANGERMRAVEPPNMDASPRFEPTVWRREAISSAEEAQPAPVDRAAPPLEPQPVGQAPPTEASAAPASAAPASQAPAAQAEAQPPSRASRWERHSSARSQPESQATDRDYMTKLNELYPRALTPPTLE